MTKSDIVLYQRDQTLLDRAIHIFKNNPSILLVARIYNINKKKSIKPSYRNMTRDIKAINPKANISAVTIGNWIKEVSSIFRYDKVYKAFLDRLDINEEDIKPGSKKLFAITYGKQAVKDKKQADHDLKEDINKAKIILAEFITPDMSDSEKWRLADRGRRQVDKINKDLASGGMVKATGINELYDINGKLLAKGKQIILDNIGKIDVKHFGDLKALSDIMDTAFKQNRLISGESTENVAIGINEIYDQIVQENDKQSKVIDYNPSKSGE